ncbi:hypothetical protein SAMN06265173_11272 [Thalassovita litoralis]|jgi:Ca2+/Na+ antiporter|uniref:Cation/multidrug efflux pump n=1 Tax=Thalassovita litoralis TaxID=1010611 RepID=A0A521DSD6_9RHOB|nr:hypothetical protein [Thalassovita litoralis]SMO74663.1 hypothetical protein SAMN06265173_11272 [Thalassovita litoralis]
MLGLLRLVVVGFVVLSVIYVIVSIWSRRVRRGKLEREWDEEVKRGDREDFIEDGLDDYDDSFRRKLILLVYIVPVAIVALIIYLVNYR